MARAFEVILHNGVTGKIYNIGGTHEKANIDVAKDLIRLMGKGDEEVRDLRLICVYVRVCMFALSKALADLLAAPPKKNKTEKVFDVGVGPGLQRPAVHGQLGGAQAARMEGGGAPRMVWERVEQCLEFHDCNSFPCMYPSRWRGRTACA